MTDLEANEIAEIRKTVTSDPAYVELNDEVLRERIEEKLRNRIRQMEGTEAGIYYSSLSFKGKKGLVNTIFESIRGLGILGTIISDKTITEVMINGYDNIFVERAGRVEKLNEHFESKENLRNVITRFVQDMGRSVNESNPIVDSRLADGSRVNVVLDPIALDGPIVTIRRFPEEGMTIEKLIAYGSITKEASVFLEKLVEAKYNIFISGGTGSGKTTFLNALSNYIPKDERVITIEDSAELQIKNVPNLVRLETRNANSTGAGGITIRDLIKSSLRMRPERIVVGEVRGAEALDMLQAMNTGHDGSLSTGHANSSKDMLSRLETMVLSGAVGVPLDAIRQQIASALDIIIHLSRMRDKSRKVVEITEVVGIEGADIILNPLFVFEEDENVVSNKVSGNLNRTNNRLKHPDKFIAAGIYDILGENYRKGG